MFNLLTAVTTDAPIYNPTQLIIGLVIGVFLLVFFVVKTKIHAFMALIISAMLVALIGGVSPSAIPPMITGGFGGTLGSIGIIIGLGIIMGQLFELSGAAERMALTFIKLFGKGREQLALAITGMIVSIPVFCDSAFVILFPIAKSISRKTRQNIVKLAGGLAIGLGLTHTVAPPTPGPLAAAMAFNVDLGAMILGGVALSIPCLIAALIYINRFADKELYIAPTEDGEDITFEREALNLDAIDLSDPRHDLPSTLLAFLPILLPIVLIVIENFVNAGFIPLQGMVREYVRFIGTPIVAVAIGTLIAIYTLTKTRTRDEVLGEMDEGIKAAGIILLVTGGGGALGRVIQDTGLGGMIADGLTGIGIPLIILPFIIATIVRFIQGSGTVSIVTAANITAPIILEANANGANVNLLLAALAASMGGLFFSYFNDSYFHVVNRLTGIKDGKMQMKFWSGTTTVAWAVGGIIIIALSFII